MTDTLREKINLWKDLIWLAGVISTIITFVCTLLITSTMYIYGDSLKAYARNWLGITEIQQQILDFTGTSRVTKQPMGQSYVREPVYEGETVEVVMLIGRTRLGSTCQLEGLIPLFTDDRNVVTSGTPRRSKRQLSEELSRVILEEKIPKGVSNGRTTIEYQLNFMCGDKRIIESTYPIPFYILEDRS